MIQSEERGRGLCVPVCHTTETSVTTRVTTRLRRCCAASRPHDDGEEAVASFIPSSFPDCVTHSHAGIHMIFTGKRFVGMANAIREVMMLES